MVVVIGAGLAGLSAALHLAEEGVDVTLCERHPEFLGGRTQQRRGYRFAFQGEEHEHTLDHGQHCIWFQYNNMRALLKRLGMFERSIRPCEYTCYVLDDGKCVKRLEPFDVHPDRVQPTLVHFLAHLAKATRVPGWSHLDTLRLARALPRLFVAAGFRHDKHYDSWDELSVSEFFAWIGLPDQMNLIFKSLCKASTFHPHTEISASWAMSMMESTMIGHPADHAMWCFRGNLGTHLIDPLAQAARAKGVRILKNARVCGIERTGERISAVRIEPTSSGLTEAETLTTSIRLTCDAVIAATDIRGFQEAMLPDLSDRPEILSTANLETIGNVTIRVITSVRLAEHEPWLGLFAGKFHFLDAYFLLSRYQDEFMRWSARTGGEVIELHSYFAQREIEASSPELARQKIEQEVLKAWPELKGNIVHIETFANERTFDKQAVGHGRHQPGIRTSVPNLFVCGSWVKVDTAIHDMEKAVTTGMMAANDVLKGQGLKGVAVLPLRPRTLLQNIFSHVAERLPRPAAVRPMEQKSA